MDLKAYFNNESKLESTIDDFIDCCHKFYINDEFDEDLLKLGLKQLGFYKYVLKMIESYEL